MSRRCAQLSVVTSLYRSAERLPAFLAALEAALKTVERRGLRVQAVIVANQPDKHERKLLRKAMERRWWRQTCKLIEVPRETLYASWNRGVRASSGEVVTFWNVDDDRNPEALIEGVRLVEGGAALVVLPWLKAADDSTAEKVGDRALEVMDRDRLEALDPSADFILGPFFMVSRELFDACGLFDEQFHIIGDLDWQLRLPPGVKVAGAKSLGGVFYLHAGNLSHTALERLHVEQNVVAQRFGLDRPMWPLGAAGQKMAKQYAVRLPAGGRGAGGGKLGTGG